MLENDGCLPKGGDDMTGKQNYSQFPLFGSSTCMQQ